MSDWKDITSYSRGDKDRTPTTWALQLGGGLRITVTKGHIYYQGIWVMHCEAVNIHALELGIADAMPLEQAQQAAIDRVWVRLSTWVEALSGHGLPPQRSNYKERGDYAEALEREGEG